MTSEDHNKYLAWTFMLHGGFQLLITLLLIAIFLIAFSVPREPGSPPPPEFLFVIFGVVFVFHTLFVAPSFVAAFALFKRKKWARIASIVGGVVSAMNVPFGTLACVYALWYFLGDNWKHIYSDIPFGVENSRGQLPSEIETRWTGYYTNEAGEIVFNPVDPPNWR